MIYLVYRSILDLTATVTTPERNFAWLDRLHGGPPSEAVVNSLSQVCSLVQEVAIENQVPWGGKQANTIFLGDGKRMQMKHDPNLKPCQGPIHWIMIGGMWQWQTPRPSHVESDFAPTRWLWDLHGRSPGPHQLSLLGKDWQRRPRRDFDTCRVVPGSLNLESCI